MENKPLSPLWKLILLTGVFLFFLFVPLHEPLVSGALMEGLYMLGDYAREHVLLCLVPAFFIAGAIMVFLNQQNVLKYLGPDAKPVVAYSIASLSGAILAVCSCTVLPIFKGIRQKGAGLGPAVSFLYSGPAINVMAIILTAKVLGWELGLARTIAAVGFAFLIGLVMHLLFRKEDLARNKDTRPFAGMIQDDKKPFGKTGILLVSMMGFLVFANWSVSGGNLAFWDFIFSIKYFIAGFFALLMIVWLILFYKKDEVKGWLVSSRDFALQIVPLLFIGVIVSGFLFGRPGHPGLVPSGWIAGAVGGNSILSNLIASVSGALMYFATLTEIPILQGLMGAGMGKGPALALLLAGPSLSLPSMLVIGGELGWKKTGVYAGLVVVFSTLAGWVFGMIINGGIA